MKGLVNCNFLPGSARRLELAEPLSRAYWSQNSGRSAKRLACRARVLLAKVPIALKRAVGLSGPSAAISAHPAAMVGTGMPKLRDRTGNEAIAMPTAPSLERDSAAGRRTPGN